MSLAVTKEKFNILLLQVLVFSLPIYQKFVPILIVAFAISTIYIFIKSKHKIKLTKATVFLLLFYLTLGVGLLWTDNMKTGVFDLEVKMSLFIFPVLFSLIKYEKEVIVNVVRALTFGVLAFFVVAIYFAFQNYFAKSDGYHHFLYARLSPIVHPSYMSMYIVIAVTFTLTLFNKGIFVFKNKLLTLIMVGVLLVINLMILSKIGIVISILISFYYLYLWLRITKKYSVGIGAVLAVILFFSVVYHKVGYVAQRVDEFMSIFSSDKNDVADKSSGVRLHIWEHATTLVKEKPFFGHGTGDVKDVLMVKYKEFNLTTAIEHQLNAHNQFFQILISSGVVALLLFLFAAYFGVKLNSFFAQFIVIIFIYMLVESTLENQAGTIFFGLFFGLLSQKSLSAYDKIKIK